MKKRVVSLLAIMLCASMVACGQSNGQEGNEAASSGGKREDQTTLTILCEAGSPGEMVAKSTEAEFESAHPGVDVVVDPVPYSGIFDKVGTEVKSGKIVHDVVTLDVLWLAAFENNIEPLNDYVTSEMTDDFLPTMQEGGTLNGNLLGMPMWINSKVLMYRKSLFEDANNQTKFKEAYGYDLVVPTTWEEYLDAAEFFTDAENGMYGTAVYGASDGDTVCSWLDHAAQAGADPLVLDGDKVLIDEQPYIDAANFMKEQFDKGVVPPDSLSNASGEVINYFNNGQLAMMINWSHFYPSASEALNGDVGVAPMIGGTAGVGATTGPWYEAVLKDSKNKELAIEYLKFMYDHNGDYMEASLKIAGRTSVYEKYAQVEGNEHLQAVLDTLGQEASGNRPNTPYWTEIEKVLGDAIHSVIAGEKPAEDAMSEAKTEIERIIQ